MGWSEAVSTPIWRDATELAALPWSPDNLRRCDPYLVWADVTRQLPQEADAYVAVLVELKDADGYVTFREGINGNEAIHFIPNSLEQQTGTRFITGLARRTRLPWLIEAVQRGVIKRFTLQQSRTDLLADQIQMDKCYQQALLENDEQAGASGALRDDGPPGCFVGVIDDGFPLHRLRAWMQKGALQRIHLWDQGWAPRHSVPHTAQAAATKDRYWQAAWGWYAAVPDVENSGRGFRGFLYGRLLQNIAGLPPGDDYQRSGYCSPTPRHSHGAAVLGLAAPWVAQGGPTPTWPDHVSGLALVQLPTCTVDDTSGGSLAMHVLDGLRFILWQESLSRPAGRARPVVVNLSYGVQGGPHDGSSMFERALSEMLEQHPLLQLALPAGNAHLAGCHARRDVASKGKADFVLRVLPDNGGDTHVELWLPEDANVELRICPPGVVPADALVLTKGQSQVCYEPGATGGEPKAVHFAATYASNAAHSETRQMILLSIGPTRRRSRWQPGPTPAALAQRVVQAHPGLWRLEVRNQGAKPVVLDAWVERDDAAPDRRGGSRQAYFPDSADPDLYRGNATPEGTLNGIATARHDRAHVVGAMRVDGRLAAYSAAVDGTPSAAQIPRVVAPADWSQSLSGLRTWGLAPGARARVNGTSAACAVYTRALVALADPDHMSLPWQPPPVAGAPEIDTGPERQPAADDALRGQKRRMRLLFELDH